MASPTRPVKPHTAARSTNDVPGALILGGLGVALVTQFWTHPISFLIFIVLGGGLVGSGVLLFLIGIAGGRQ